MKTITQNNPHQEKLATFNLLVAEKDSNFTLQLKDVMNECQNLFPYLDFKTNRITDANDFQSKSIQDMQLVFIEDAFLLSIERQKVNKNKIKQDVVLLLDGHFIGEEAFKIKQAIHENSLNLTGHISLTNYPFNLVKLLVIDFIKSKLQ